MIYDDRKKRAVLLDDCREKRELFCKTAEIFGDKMKGSGLEWGSEVYEALEHFKVAYDIYIDSFVEYQSLKDQLITEYEHLKDSIFGRENEDGYVALFYASSGERVTRLDKDVYPVGSSLSAKYEHPEGIVLGWDDAEALGLYVEDEEGRLCPAMC